MSLGTNLQSTANALMKKFQVTDRPVYLRTVTSTGGDALIGRPGTVASVDALLTPQPVVHVITGNRLGMGYVNGNVMAQIGDYFIVISGSAVTRAQLQSRNVFLVMYDGTEEEVLEVVYFDPAVVNGIDVVFDVVARSKSR